MSVLQKIVLALLPTLLISCSSIETDPNPKPQPDPPRFRRCQTCEGTDCVTVWIGQKTCKVETDAQGGKSCTANGTCFIGTFGAVSVPFQGADEPGGPQPLPPADATVLAARARFNDLFQQGVVGKLESCWDDIEGQGAVTIEHDYVRREENDWAPYDLRVVHSTLPGDQDDLVGRCMRQAVDGVFLPYDPSDGEEQELLLIWTWAVPLPDSTG